MTRRSFFAALTAAGALPAILPRAGLSPATAPRTSMGIGAYSFSQPMPPIEFLEYCASLGAGGVQTELPWFESDYAIKLRQRAEELGMYVEVVANLPRGDSSQFERAVRVATDAGAVCVRSACLDGRRYEEFSRLDEWQRFVAESKARIARALPIVERQRMPLGLENHKDWTTEEFLALLKDYNSEYLGVCLDTGNNLALLDDPTEIVEALAPYAVSTHIKDMAVEEYTEGFLLAEVPLGEGILDMKRIVTAVARARPKTKFTLEMITRNPLRIPCLADKYWATFPERSGKLLARTLRMVRSAKPRRPLPTIGGLDSGARFRLEEDNVMKCLDYAREELGLGLP